MPTETYLSEIWSPATIEDYKVHFARWNGDEQPVDVIARSLEEWTRWQQWYPSKNDFNRPFIFAIAQMKHDRDRWLFGGIWRVNGIVETADGRMEYDVDLTDELRSLLGRLVLHRVHKGRGTRLRLEGHYSDFIVSEILPQRYAGRSFPGYDSVHIPFAELETLIANSRLDWITALSNIKGIYLVSDLNTNRRYVGSAYGDTGIWSRWMTYSCLGHGGNSGMVKLLQGHDLAYCRKHFSLALLEHFDARTEDETVLARESYWKRVLGTRHEDHGLNFN